MYMGRNGGYIGRRGRKTAVTAMETMVLVVETGKLVGVKGSISTPKSPKMDSNRSASRRPTTEKLVWYKSGKTVEHKKLVQGGVKVD